MAVGTQESAESLPEGSGSESIVAHSEMVTFLVRRCSAIAPVKSRSCPAQAGLPPRTHGRERRLSGVVSQAAQVKHSEAGISAALDNRLHSS